MIMEVNMFNNNISKFSNKIVFPIPSNGGSRFLGMVPKEVHKLYKSSMVFDVDLAHSIFPDIIYN